MAHLSGPLPEHAPRCGRTERSLHSRHRQPRADRRSGDGLLRQGVRHHVPGPAPERCRRPRPRGEPADAPGHARARGRLRRARAGADPRRPSVRVRRRLPPANGPAGDGRELADLARVGGVREPLHDGDRRRHRRVAPRPARRIQARWCFAPDAGVRDVGLRPHHADGADGVHGHRVRPPLQARLRFLLSAHEAPRHRVSPRVAVLRRANRIREPDPLDLRRLALPARARSPPQRGARRRSAAVGQREPVSGLHPGGPPADAGARVIAEVAGAIVQVLVVGAGAPLLVGALRTLKARLVGRRGPSPWQPYANLRKLLVKEAVVSTTTSWVFRATPYILAAALLVTGLIVPVTTTRPPLAFAGNIILLVYLFMLGTFFLALAGLDVGSAFGGMGASREVAVAALAEPTVIVAVFALALRADTIDLGRIVERFRGEPWLAANPAHLLAFAAFFIVMLAETGRLPVDNPATHLELTMIHEAMVLEYSGRYLALVEWAAAMKLFLFMTLLANLFVPWGLREPTGPVAALLGLLALAGKLALLTTAVAVLETAVAKLRLFRVPELLAGSFALAFLSLMAVFLVR
ncbi:MAG: hypothetical protein DME00_01910 [Candidatus Rokuibacteriota bacterium]|nr:MAG: hypothetical protein DME00_01910 [Candidatus Rokubacteria bacterium]